MRSRVSSEIEFVFELDAMAHLVTAVHAISLATLHSELSALLVESTAGVSATVISGTYFAHSLFKAHS